MSIERDQLWMFVVENTVNLYISIFQSSLSLCTPWQFLENRYIILTVLFRVSCRKRFHCVMFCVKLITLCSKTVFIIHVVEIHMYFRIYFMMSLVNIYFLHFESIIQMSLRTTWLCIHFELFEWLHIIQNLVAGIFCKQIFIYRNLFRQDTPNSTIKIMYRFSRTATTYIMIMMIGKFKYIDLLYFQQQTSTVDLSLLTMILLSLFMCEIFYTFPFCSNQSIQ